MDVRKGFFCAAYNLYDTAPLDQYTLDRIEVRLGWFRENPEIPCRFNRTRSKGAFQRNTKGSSPR
ncbi:hypothetical protein [Ruegeria sp. ANG-R]|uniref:hypothetical protein n=1 Tax=Ruegeria sp. ANG-R TaxID=1577903 RepID=UPI000A9F7340|nr:hypothetical protein [Ruegeria sp. ANG-R]